MTTTSVNALTPEILMGAIASVCNVTIDQIKSSDRHWSVVTARQLAMYLLRERLGLSWKSIGALLNRDHSTVIYGHKQIKDAIDAAHYGVEPAEETRYMMMKIDMEWVNVVSGHPVV